MSSPCLKSLIAHRIKYNFLIWSTRPSMAYSGQPLHQFLQHFLSCSLCTFYTHFLTVPSSFFFPFFFFNSPKLAVPAPGPLHLLLPRPGFGFPVFHMTFRCQLREAFPALLSRTPSPLPRSFSILLFCFIFFVIITII